MPPTLWTSPPLSFAGAVAEWVEWVEGNSEVCYNSSTHWLIFSGFPLLLSLLHTHTHMTTPPTHMATVTTHSFPFLDLLQLSSGFILSLIFPPLHLRLAQLEITHILLPLLQANISLYNSYIIVLYITLSHTNLSNNWLSPNGLSAFVYPWKQVMWSTSHTHHIGHSPSTHCPIPLSIADVLNSLPSLPTSVLVSPWVSPVPSWWLSVSCSHHARVAFLLSYIKA